MSIGLGDVQHAAERLTGVAHRTPVVTSRTLDERIRAHVDKDSVLGPRLAGEPAESRWQPRGVQHGRKQVQAQ